MHRAVWLGVVIATSVSAQTIYRWTDAKGTVHYTDDASSIPAGAKAATTTGTELSHMGAPAPVRSESADSAPPAPAPSAAGPQRSEEEAWRENFRSARERVRSLEDELALDLKKLEDPSRTPLGPSIVCPGPWAYGGPTQFRAPRSSGFGSQTQFGASANIPLGNGATLGVNAGVNSSFRGGNFSGFGPLSYGYSPSGYGPVGYGAGPCWYQADSEYNRAHERVERIKASLSRAREDLADLERRAANAAIPLEWRR